MALIIGFGAPARLALEQLETWPDTSPDVSAFWLPEGARSGDRVLWYVGGSLQAYVGLGRTTSDWSKGRSGSWAGVPFMGTSKPRRILPFVPGADVARACGLAVPKDAGVVPTYLARHVLAFVQGKPIDPMSRALEGAMTEARSRHRDPGLRAKARALAKGRCACCEVDFAKVAGGSGQRCLVVHHTRQIRDYDDKKETKLSDLVVVCANCHMLIHSDPDQALSVAAVRAMLTRTRGSR